MTDETLEWFEDPAGISGVRGKDFFVHSGFNFAVYREGERTIQFKVQRGFRNGKHLMVIPQDAFAYWDHSATNNKNEDQERMRANFIAAIQFAGVTVE